MGIAFLAITIFTLIIAIGWFSIIKKESAIGRVLIYEVSCRMILDNWLWGVGANRFQVFYNFYQSQYFQTSVSKIGTQQLASNTFEGFNFFLQWWAEYGLLSILSGGAICYYKFQKKRSLWYDRKKRDHNGYLAATICILFSGLFSNPFHCSVTSLLFVCLLASAGRNNCTSHIPIKLTKARFLNPLAAALSIYFLYFGLIQLRAEIKWKKAASIALFETLQKARPLYEEAYENLRTDGRFLYNYGVELSLANDYEQSISLLKQASHYYSSGNLYMYLGLDYSKTGDYKSAERNFLKAIYTTPGALLPKYQLILLYLKLKRADDAKAWIMYTINYPVKIRDEVSDKILSTLKKLQPK